MRTECVPLFTNRCKNSKQSQDGSVSNHGQVEKRREKAIVSDLWALSGFCSEWSGSVWFPTRADGFLFRKLISIWGQSHLQALASASTPERRNIVPWLLSRYPLVPSQLKQGIAEKKIIMEPTGNTLSPWHRRNPVHNLPKYVCKFITGIGILWNSWNCYEFSKCGRRAIHEAIQIWEHSEMLFFFSLIHLRFPVRFPHYLTISSV